MSNTMVRKKKRMQWITPRRLAGVGCVVALALAALFVVVLYQQVRSLFSPTPIGPDQGMPTQDVAVERGSISDGISLYGMVVPARRASLGFRVARGRVVSMNVQPGQPVRAGDVLVRLDREALERDVAQARAELLTARKELDSAGTVGREQQRLQFQLELTNARAALDEARRALAAYDSGSGTPQEERQRAVTELDSARAALATLQNDAGRRQMLDEMQLAYNQVAAKHHEMATLPNPSEQDRDMEWLLRIDKMRKGQALESARLSYEMELRAAEHRIALAERTIQALDREIAAGRVSVERARRVAAVKQAEATVRQIEARLASLDEQTLAVAEAEARAKVVKLEGKVADAEAALAEAELVAPFDGVVEEVTQLIDARVTSSAPIVTIADLSSLSIVAQIPDADISRVKAGQEARILFEAFRGQPPVTGRLGEIPAYGRNEGGVTFYEVPVTFEAQGLPLQQGMTANLFVPLDTKEDVLLVPLTAIQSYYPAESFVWLVRGGKVVQQKVEMGLSDGVMAEVLSGLREGDMVRVPLMQPGGFPYGGKG
ncbi:MAG: efflux RND transporter periplasmic adaptor subunit [Anaerolineae bacterium]|nr:efflux RND transporter periplasmic adaptor subunit [Anaerolineae bacterium]